MMLVIITLSFILTIVGYIVYNYSIKLNRINKNINDDYLDEWIKDYDIHITEKRKENSKKIRIQNKKEVSDWINLKKEYLDNI